MYLRYLKVVCRHKWFVFRAGLRTGAPLWRLAIHDWSKFSPAEYGAYARRFCTGRAGQLDNAADPTKFHLAWTHHWHKNPHHWEHWLIIIDNELHPTRMPHKLVREMVADWMGAGRAYTGSWNVAEWYEKNKDRMLLHDQVRLQVENLIANHGRGE